MQKRYQWRLKQREILLGERTLLMGVLNVTPDSFSDGGKYLDPERAYARALELEDEGADILDIGKLRVPISVDTYKSAVAEKALEHGAEIINDPTGILLDLQLPKVVTKYDAGLIINHMRGNPETWAKLGPLKDLMRSIAIDLEAAVHRARQAGVQKQQVVIDPAPAFL
jgi:dihydropteroate synthase